jgi:hypothetical protein
MAYMYRDSSLRGYNVITCRYIVFILESLVGDCIYVVYITAMYASVICVYHLHVLDVKILFTSVNAVQKYYMSW